MSQTMLDLRQHILLHGRSSACSGSRTVAADPVTPSPHVDDCIVPRLSIRRLASHDREAILAHFLRLGAAERHGRFHACLGDEAITAYVRSLDFRRMILVGAIDSRDGSIVGIAEAHLDDASEPGAAELAVTVLKASRGRGVGRRLVTSVIALAFERGATRVDIFFLCDNRALIRLIEPLGFRIYETRGCVAAACRLAGARADREKAAPAGSCLQ